MLKRTDYVGSSASKPGPYGLWDNKQGEGSVTIQSVLYNQQGQSVVISCITKNDVQAMMANLNQGEYLVIISKFMMNDGFYPTMTLEMLADKFDILITKDAVYSKTGEYGDEGVVFTSKRTGLSSKLIKSPSVLSMLKSS